MLPLRTCLIVFMLIFRIMIYYLWFVFCTISSSYAQQYYDPSNCSISNMDNPGSRYTCNSSQKDSWCSTYLVYRAQPNFQTISDISYLFQKNSGAILQANNLKSSLQNLRPRKEVLLPISCSCNGQFFHVNFSYIVPESTTFSDIACGVFEGLLKARTLSKESPLPEDKLSGGSKLHVPLRCACPDNSTSINKVKYLITYPLLSGDNADILSQKFNISDQDIYEANHIDSLTTLFPNTTLLIPLKDHPKILDIQDSPPPAQFLPTNPVTNPPEEVTRAENLYIAGSIIGFSVLLIAMLSIGMYKKTMMRSKTIQSFTVSGTPTSSTALRSYPAVHIGISPSPSCLSPDFLVDIKYCLQIYSFQELEKATRDFSEDTKIGSSAYKGLLANNAEVMIKKMRYEDTRRTIHLHSRINHINIVNLHGVCYIENDFSWSYLVFELPKVGCLRDCLSNSCNPLHWNRRTQIAFDVATGLHYLHCCSFPSYAHMNLSSRNIFITSDWRAKLADIGMTSSSSAKGNDGVRFQKGWVAPEYIVDGTVSEKVDIFAYGFLLLELLSAKEDIDGKSFKDLIGFLGGEAIEGGCFEGLRSFMDPNLKDYNLAEAFCLAVLGKACLADDPQHRPTMNDIMKVLARMV